MRLLSCHTSGCDAALKQLPVAEFHSLPAAPDPSLPQPTGGPSPLRWRAPLPDIRRIWLGTQRALSALFTALARAASGGQPGPSLLLMAVRASGARLTCSQSGARRAPAPGNPHLFALYLYQYCALDGDCTRPFLD